MIVQYPVVFFHKSPILVVLELTISHVTRFIEAPERSTVDLEMNEFSSQKIMLKICLTSLYDF